MTVKEYEAPTGIEAVGGLSMVSPLMNLGVTSRGTELLVTEAGVVPVGLANVAVTWVEPALIPLAAAPVKPTTPVGAEFQVTWDVTFCVVPPKLQSAVKVTSWPNPMVWALEGVIAEDVHGLSVTTKAAVPLTPL